MFGNADGELGYPEQRKWLHEAPTSPESGAERLDPAAALAPRLMPTDWGRLQVLEVAFSNARFTASQCWAGTNPARRPTRGAKSGRMRIP